ncbi:MAG: nicotinate (nicotinamide) nucleotide adenylyltransferase [Marinagarivorans sp.]|nr:nicotinate (nicotinamide) nucleotide adenylyltransferase [Marinagarivorans sp.]
MTPLHAQVASLKTHVYLGGTFNPLHNGHVRMLIDAAETFNASAAYFVPCHIPPHKPTPSINSAARVVQLQHWLAANPRVLRGCRVDIENYELSQTAASYTLNTLRYLRQQQGADCALIWVIGMDSLVQLDRWHQWQRLLDYAHIAVVARPDVEMALAPELAGWWQCHLAAPEALTLQSAGLCCVIDSVELAISSTQVRECYAAGKSAQGLVPECIDSFIKPSGWYMA